MGLLIGLLIVSVVCGVIGLWFGEQRNRQTAGFWLGFLFGPFGWLLTLLLPTENGSRDPPSGVGRSRPEQRGIGRCPTCGGGLIGQYPKCPHCASDVFWAGNVPTRSVQDASEEQERWERLAAERQRELKAELEKQYENQRYLDERERRWKEQKRKALRWGEERSRATLVAIVLAARWLLPKARRALRGFTQHRRDVRVRRVFVPARWWGRKADRALRRWSNRLGTLNEVGMRRCLWLVSTILLILVFIIGAWVMNRGGGKRPQPIRGADEQGRASHSTATAPDSSPKRHLTKAQEERIRLRLQSLFAALYSLPSSGPADQLANVMQQRANLQAEIAYLEAELGDTAQSKDR